MPMTPWNDIPKGTKCQICEVRYATHYYGSNLICCRCHVYPDGEGLFSEAEAKEYHECPEK